jgi:hypothetical protein
MQALHRKAGFLSFSCIFGGSRLSGIGNFNLAESPKLCSCHAD